jgi:copper chaperone CopZ
MKTHTVTINGMHCAACEKVVTKRISAIPGVQNVQVDVENGKVTITSEKDILQENIADVLQDTHYSVISI